MMMMMLNNDKHMIVIIKYDCVADDDDDDNNDWLPPHQQLQVPSNNDFETYWSSCCLGVTTGDQWLSRALMVFTKHVGCIKDQCVSYDVV